MNGFSAAIFITTFSHQSRMVKCLFKILFFNIEPFYRLDFDDKLDSVNKHRSSYFGNLEGDLPE